MRDSKIEQLGLAHRHGFRQFVDIEAAAEVGDLRRHVLLAERNRPPLETLARKRKNVALVGPRHEEYKCFVEAKQHLHLFGRERLAAEALADRLIEASVKYYTLQLEPLDCRRGRGLTGPLGEFEGLVSGRRRRRNSRACRNRPIRICEVGYLPIWPLG